MKSSKLVYLLAAGLAVTFTMTGCKSPQNAKRIPGKPRPIARDEALAPPLELTNAEMVPPPVPIEENDNLTNWVRNASALADQTVYFDFDNARIKTSEKSKISAVAAYLQSNSRTAVEVQGNCDERGTEEYNRSLGERRALAVREGLVAAGIEPRRVTVISFGEDNPVDREHNAAAWKKNRRADFVLLTPPQ